MRRRSLRVIDLNSCSTSWAFEMRLAVAVFDEFNQMRIYRHHYWPITTTELVPP
jgi:hypothetical protein